MTPDEMRSISNQASDWMDAGMINKVVSVLWWVGAEICERLDKILEQKQEQENKK